MRRTASATLLALMTSSAAVAADGSPVLTGPDAYGGWEKAKPGTTRLIRPQDLPAPYATRSASNSPGTAEKPADVMPAVPEGFAVSEWAADFNEPRVIAIAPNGDVFVADSGAGTVIAFRPGADGRPADRQTFAGDLDQPYGIAFWPPGPNPTHVYVAETNRVVRYPYDGRGLTATGAAETVVPSLPEGGHWTRDLAFSTDGKTLYVAVGSQSNVAEGDRGGAPPEGFAASAPLGAAWGDEADRAALLAFDADGGNKRLFATGLRNCSGLTIQPDTGVPWCVVNERDGLGDDLPPDYATSVGEGRFYGWPWTYIGDNEDPRHAGARPDLKGRTTVPDVLFQAHSAPLGIAFDPVGVMGPDTRGDAYVAMHGSWNRDRRTGYKVVRLSFENGKATGAYTDVMTGFVLDDQTVWGRPVDVAVTADGALLVSDDGSGRLWRIAPSGGTTSSTTTP